MRKWKGVLFDFDGVVVNSTPLHLRGWEHAYHVLFRQKLDSETLQQLVGRSTSGIGRILAEKSGFPSAKATLVQMKVEYITKYLHEIEPIAGIFEVLAHLRQERIPHGIVSNAPSAFILATLENLNLSFPFVLGLENYQRPKPDAEPYMKGAQRLPGIKFTDHKDIIVFEDSTHGIEAAVAAHMTPMGICSQHSEEILIAAGAQACFPDLHGSLSLFLDSGRNEL